MKPSDHDQIAAKIREEERQKLIDHYIEVAMQNSADYGFLNVRGHEVPSPEVVEPPLGYVQQPDIFEMMRRMVRNELSKAAEDQGFETFEEADDFEVEDDPIDFVSPWEEFFDPAPGEPKGPPGEVRAAPNEETPKDVGGVQGGDPPAEGAPKAP